MAQYVQLTGIFAALLLGTLVLSRPRKSAMTLTELALMGVATHKLSRMVTKDRVTSPLRAPFTRYVGDGEPGEVEEESRGQGAQKAVGDLVTCPYCLSPWVACGLTGLWAFSPRSFRLICGLFSSVAVSHFLHHFYSKTEPSSDGSSGSPDSHGPDAHGG